MTARVAVLSDIHGNAVALEAVRAAIRAAAPDAVLVCGDLAFNGPDPCAAVDAVREMESEGALVIAGNTDVAVADFDWAAAFPWFPEGPPSSFVAAAEWAHVELGSERVDWLRRLPSERRLHAEGSMLLACHASPGSQTAGFDADLDPTVVLDRIMRTEARVICCGHTHLPEVRDFGWKMIVNDGSAGYIFDGEPTASWALVTLDGESVAVDIRRTEFDALTVANAISERGLPGDVYRAATVRTGKLVR
jgi:putative phosphoesterase